MNLRDALGAAAVVALVTVVGVSVLQRPESRTENVTAGPNAASADESAADTIARLAAVAPSSTIAPTASSTTPSTVTSTTTAEGTSTATSTAATSLSANESSTNTVRANTQATVRDAPTSSPTRAPTLATSPSAAPFDKAAVQLGVVNASGKNGTATKTAEKLKADGWTPTSESASWPSTAFSVVYYDVGQQAAAEGVAATLGLSNAVVLAANGAAPWKQFSTRRYDVLVLAGKDLR